MRHLKKLYLLVIPLGLLSMGAGYAATGVQKPTTTGPHTLTPERIEYLNMHTNVISTHFGTFYRHAGASEFPEDEIVHSVTNVNSHTRVIITNFGTFVKDR